MQGLPLLLPRVAGLQLHMRKLRKVHVMTLIENFGARLLRWKRKLLSPIGRLTLVNLSPLFIANLSPYCVPSCKVGNQEARQSKLTFLWKGCDQASGCQCLVKWARVCRPKKLGGLGIFDLENFGRALRLRWL